MTSADPGNSHLLEKLAVAEIAQGDTEQAETNARAALVIHANDESAMQTLAQLEIKNRNCADAVEWLKQVNAMDPKNAWTHVELGVAYGQLGQPEEAVLNLAPALATEYPDSKGALHAMLASALRKLGRDDEARQAAAEAERLANSSLENSADRSGDAPQ
jgi:predicted Zn-dependent protease